MRKDRGFTLIELLIVVAIIGIIAAIAIPNLLNAINRGRQKRTMADMRTIATGIEQYQVDNSFYPRNFTDDLDGLSAYIEPTYVKKMPRNDGWNHAFHVTIDTLGNNYTIISYGKDDAADGGTYDAGTRTTNFNKDIVYAGGQFIQWPEGMQID